MAQTREGRIKQLCNKYGFTFQYYCDQVAAGNKWCTACKDWHPIDDFNPDPSRYDGMSAMCKDGRKTLYKKFYEPKDRPQKGRCFVVPRDGDKSRPEEG